MNKKNDGWFALFCTAEIPLQKINDTLEQAADGNSSAAVKKGWYFWLASDDFRDAQDFEKRPDGSDRLATEAPVDAYTSPYLGKDIATLAQELVHAPDEAWINRVFFAVMDQRTADDGSLLLCHIEEDESVDSLRAWPKNSSLYFMGMSISSGTWDELKHSWNRHRERGHGDVID